MATPSKRSPVAPGHKLAGKYRVEREIGAGSMGVVVEAWHVELDQRVAIKFLYPEFASHQEGAERFRREARASARIENEHVAKVLDIGTLDEGRTLYYVMEFLRGHDLSRELSLHGPLAVKTAVDYVLEACEALEEAHAKGIVHRDLKPANLFLVERPNGGEMVKIVDFGISKITGGTGRQFSLTDTSIMMGSPAYMCPEQLESSRSVDGRADIWSLGVILHELILGEIPFRGDSVPQLVGSILLGKRMLLTSRPGVPADLEAVVARCLRQTRDERYADIRELREALIPFSTLGRRPPPSNLPMAVGSSGATPAPGAPVPAARITPPPTTPVWSSQLSALAGEPAGPAAALLADAAVLLDGLAGASAAEQGAPQTAGLQSGSDPISWGRTQRGQSWRQAMYRRGLPAALFATLALVGVYLVLRPSSVPPASSSPVAATAPEIERPNVSPSVSEPSAKPPGAPVVRSLQPAPEHEQELPPPTALEQPRVQALPPPELPSARGTKAPPVSAPPAVSPKPPAAALARPVKERPAPSVSQDSVDGKSTRPSFLKKLDNQDYGGRE
jgi:serine/threonine protein kinase